jgi:hypothetical protein
MSEMHDFNRRRFFGVAAATVAAGPLGLFEFSTRVEAFTRQHLGSLDKVSRVVRWACRWPPRAMSAISRKSLTPPRMLEVIFEVEG